MSRVTAWYVSVEGKATGPVSTEMVKSMIRGGQIQALDLIFREGDVEWLPVASHPELSESKKTWNRSTDLQDDFTPSVSPLVTWIVLRPHGGTYLQEGPFSTAAVAEGLRTGRFLYAQYAWRAGLDRWRRIGDLAEFDRRDTVRGGSGVVPPPLPDPIEAILLEDDSEDDDVEEFQVLMSPGDRTPAPDVSVSSRSEPAPVVAIGGAAAESPELRAPRAEGRDLAAPPWESEMPIALVVEEELTPLPSASVSRPAAVGVPVHVSAPAIASLMPAAVSTGSASVVPPERPVVLSPYLQDGWERWGRKVAAGGFAVLAMLFLSHIFFSTSDDSESQKRVVGTAVPAVVPSVAPTEAKPAVVSAPVVAVPLVTNLSILGVKLESPQASQAAFVFEGGIPVGAKIEVSIRGRLGQVFGVMNVRESRTLVRREGEVPTLPLAALRLPEGAYTVEAKVGDSRTSGEFFVGVRDGRFLSRLEYYLKEVSLQTQTQKRELFYSVKELDALARNLGANYGQLRSKPALWDRFYRKWTQDVARIERTLAGLRTNKPEMLAYPEETAELGALYTSVLEAGRQYDGGIRQSRDVASDTLSDIISELERTRLAFGDVSARPGDGQSSDGAASE
ncbi:MAG: DUF4339 domain-containing protein [Bdellovibrionales bacterium]|nr:DUF4339 domain-containing protein [Bdellovibrionales bacterium]